MSKELEILLDEIQFKTKLTLEKIGERIGYSRPYLNKAKKGDNNKKLVGILKEEFKEVLQNDTEKGMAIDLDKKSMANEIAHLKGLTKALLHSHAKLKSQVTGRSVEECLKELIDDTTLIMNDPDRQ